MSLKTGLMAETKEVHSFNIKQSFKDNVFYKETQIGTINPLTKILIKRKQL